MGRRLSPHRSGRPVGDHLPPRRVEGAEAEVSTVSMVAPYLPVLVVLAVTSIQLLRGRHIEPVGWFMALALIALVLGREGLRLWDEATVAHLRARTAGAAKR